jgi:hypothetical protein
MVLYPLGGTIAKAFGLNDATRSLKRCYE